MLAHKVPVYFTVFRYCAANVAVMETTEVTRIKVKRIKVILYYHVHRIMSIQSFEMHLMLDVYLTFLLPVNIVV